MNKDFLFLNYSWVWGSTTYFNFFEEKGHSIDIIDEKNFHNFLSTTTNKYKNIVVYLHEPHQLKIINHFLETKFKDSFVIQHDDTDSEQLQKWINKEPDLYLHRELTKNTNIKTNRPVISFHFPIKSLYDSKLNENKKYDISFIGNMTNNRRKPFVEYILDLSKNKLKHLNWYIDFLGTKDPSASPGIASKQFKEITNQSKIGLHFFGNSYDSIRIWEIMSCKTALLMPKMRNVSVDKNNMYLKNYTIFNDDYSNLEEKIYFLLENNNYKNISEKQQTHYINNHTILHCCENYYNNVIKYAKI